MVDDPKLDSRVRIRAPRGKVLIGHQGEPRNCWLPVEQMTVNNDKEYFREHPQYHMFLHPEMPSYEAADGRARSHAREVTRSSNSWVRTLRVWNGVSMSWRGFWTASASRRRSGRAHGAGAVPVQSAAREGARVLHPVSGSHSVWNGPDAGARRADAQQMRAEGARVWLRDWQYLNTDSTSRSAGARCACARALLAEGRGSQDLRRECGAAVRDCVAAKAAVLGAGSGEPWRARACASSTTRISIAASWRCGEGCAAIDGCRTRHPRPCALRAVSCAISSFESHTHESVHDELGTGVRHGSSVTAAPSARALTVTMYDEFPQLAVVQASYTESGHEPLSVRRLDEQPLRDLRGRMGDRGELWSYQSASYEVAARLGAAGEGRVSSATTIRA